MGTVRIEKVDNGYIVNLNADDDYGEGSRKVYHDFHQIVTELRVFFNVAQPVPTVAPPVFSPWGSGVIGGPTADAYDRTDRSLTF